MSAAQTTPACGMCADGFEQRAGSVNIDGNISVIESSADVRIHRNGTVTWTVRNTLRGDGMTAFNDEPQRARLLESMLAQQERTRAGNVTYLDSSFDDYQITMRYRVEGTVTRYNDQLVYTGFHSHGGTDWAVVADRLAVHAPTGLIRTNTPNVAESREGTELWRTAVIWTGSTRNPRKFSDSYVVFGPATTKKYEVMLATTNADWPSITEIFTSVHGPGLAVLAVVLALVDFARRFHGSHGRLDRVFYWGAGLSAVYLTITLVLVPPTTRSEFVGLATPMFLALAIGLGIVASAIYPKRDPFR
ncbi:MAG: hypothetical protein U5K28_07325 [Halobacteriales archaeon]|nr:hypothetical protein [Halobacteriales archaeon]